MINWLHLHYKWAQELIMQSIVDSPQRRFRWRQAAPTSPVTSIDWDRTPPAGASARRRGQIGRVLIGLNAPHFTAGRSFTVKRCSTPPGTSHWQVPFFCTSHARRHILSWFFCRYKLCGAPPVHVNTLHLSYSFATSFTLVLERTYSFIWWWVYGL